MSSYRMNSPREVDGGKGNIKLNLCCTNILHTIHALFSLWFLSQLEKI